MCKIKGVASPLPFKKIHRSLMREFVPQFLSCFQRSMTLTSFFVVFGCLFLTAQQVPAQQVPMTPPSPPPPGQAPAKKQAEPNMPSKSEGSAAVGSDYKIGPADVLKIQVWDEEKFSGMFTVDQDGKFVYPLAGYIVAGGLTTAEVKDSVEKALAKYVVKPRVDVTVQEVYSKKYYLNGMVNHPGEYMLSVPTTVLQAISKAGGLQDFANQKKIYILRGSKKIAFNYKEVSQGKRMEQNILLEPGDQLFIP
jgi:polysaccharide export outer membrane protein